MAMKVQRVEGDNLLNEKKNTLLLAYIFYHVTFYFYCKFHLDLFYAIVSQCPILEQYRIGFLFSKESKQNIRAGGYHL